MAHVEAAHQKANNIQKRKPASVCLRHAPETPASTLLASFGLRAHVIELRPLIWTKQRLGCSAKVNWRKIPIALKMAGQGV